MKQFIRSFGFAVHGIRAAVASQRHMKFHLGAAMLVSAAGIYVQLSREEWGLVLLAIGLVITAELMNSSIESLVDLLEPRQRPLAGKVKDIAAGGVLAASICALGIGILVFYKYLIA